MTTALRSIAGEQAITKTTGQPATTYDPARGPAWWPKTIRDGGLHYGQQDGDDMVRAVCGEVFAPLLHPVTRTASGQRSPADKEHACRDCLANGAPWHA